MDVMPLITKVMHRLGFLLIACLGALIFQMGSMKQGDEERFLRFQVRAEQSAQLTFFSEEEHGGGLKKEQTLSLDGGDFFQYVRFPLPRTKFLSLRVVVSLPADRLVVHDLWITDKANLPLMQIKTDTLLPVHDLQSFDKSVDQFMLHSTGGGSLVQIDISDLELRFFSLKIGQFIAITLITYFFIVVMFYLLQRNGQIGLRGEVLRIKSDPLFIGGAICCLLAAIYIVRPWRLPHSTYNVDHQESIPYFSEISGRDVGFPRSDGLNIAGQLYDREPVDRSRGAILLLHGNYPEGQQFPLYQVLAKEFAARGYLVLTIDFAGYGRSSDPFASPAPCRVDLELETEAALAYLAMMAPGGRGQITVIGHSMGADPALRVGLRNPLVKDVILLGPPRRVWERFHTASDINFFWNWAMQVGKKQYNRIGFPSWYGEQRWRQDILHRDMALMLPELVKWGHKPVLFIDGGRESRLDQCFLNEYVRRVSYPKHYVTVNGADHNSNVRQRGERIVYEPSVIGSTVGLIDSWCQERVSGKSSFSDFSRNFLNYLFGAIPGVGEERNL